MEQWWNYADRGKTEILGDNLPYFYFATYPAWTTLGSNLGLCGDRPVTGVV